jgi:hypothetical protein
MIIVIVRILFVFFVFFVFVNPWTNFYCSNKVWKMGTTLFSEFVERLCFLKKWNKEKFWCISSFVQVLLRGRKKCG